MIFKKTSKGLALRLLQIDMQIEKAKELLKHRAYQVARYTGLAARGSFNPKHFAALAKHARYSARAIESKISWLKYERDATKKGWSNAEEPVVGPPQSE